MRLSPRYAIALLAALAIFPVGLDSTIVNVAIVPISKALHTDINSIQWIFIGYLLSNAAVLPLSGYLANRFGARRLFLLGMALFTLCSLLCGLAPAESWLVGFRVIQGIGGGILMPLAMAIALDPFAREERARAMAVVALPVLLAPVVGPIIGGLLIDSLRWQSIFFVNVPIGILVVALAWRVLPPDAGEQRAADRSAAVDYPGLIFSMVGVSLLVYAFKLVSQTDPHTRTAINPQGNIYGWSYWPVWLLGAIGLALLIAFAYRALRGSRDPVLDLRLFAQRGFTVANLAIWLGSIIMFGAMFLIPVYLQGVRMPNLSPLHTGLAMLPMGLATLVGVIAGGGLYRLIGARPLVLAGSLLLGVACWLLRGLTLTTSIGGLALPLALLGLSIMLISLPAQTLALEALSGEALNKATSLVSATKLLWGSIGSAALVTAYIQYTAAHAAHLAATLPAGVRAHLTGAMHAHIAAQAATSGMVDVFTLLLWCTLILVVVALFLPGRRPAVDAAQESAPDTLDREAASA